MVYEGAFVFVFDGELQLALNSDISVTGREET